MKERSKKKILLFCPKLHKKISRISLTTKGDIFLSRARINTHARKKVVLVLYCRCCVAFSREFLLLFFFSFSSSLSFAAERKGERSELIERRSHRGRYERQRESERKHHHVAPEDDYSLARRRRKSRRGRGRDDDELGVVVSGR